MFTTLKLFVEQLQRFKLFVHIELMQTSISEHDQCEDIYTKFCVKYKNDGEKKNEWTVEVKVKKSEQNHE